MFTWQVKFGVDFSPLQEPWEVTDQPKLLSCHPDNVVPSGSLAVRNGDLLSLSSLPGETAIRGVVKLAIMLYPEPAFGLGGKVDFCCRGEVIGLPGEPAITGFHENGSAECLAGFFLHHHPAGGG